MTSSPTSPFLGGRLCVDFANAATFPSSPHAEPLSWEGLVLFLEAARIVTAERRGHLLELTSMDPQAADELLRRANRLRENFRRILAAMAKGKRIAPEWVEPINAALRVTEGHDELAWDGRKWSIAFVAREESLEWLLAAIARSAAELLVEGSSAPVRRCANPSCSMFFYDDSRTRKRRWCSMALCGNRSKVAAFARRHGERRG